MSSARATSAQPAPWNVSQLLADATAAHPELPAIIGTDGEIRLTFSELTDRAVAMAAGLVKHGLRPGDGVALLVRDREEALVPAVAVLWAGGALVVPPTARGWRTAVMTAAATRPTAVVADPATWLAVAAVPALRRAPIRIATGRRSWPGLVAIDRLRADGSGAVGGPVPRAAEAAALVSWTTGTTGRPQAIVRSHGVIAAQHDAIRRLRAPRPGDVDLAGLPNLALHDLACGVTVVMPPRAGPDLDGARLRAAVARAGVTTAAGFPALFERLVQGARGGELPLLRSLHIGGAPVRPEFLDRLAAVAPNAAIVVVYGATEVEPVAAIEGGELRASAVGAIPGRGLLVGKPCEGIEVRIASRDVATAGSAAFAATRGRILVRGARVARVPARTDADGWLDTGDVGWIDPGGRLWLLGRAANAGVGGPFPAEVEEPVAALEDVRAAVLLSLPGHGRTLSVLAVEPSTVPSTEATIRARVAALAAERCWGLDRIVIVRRLPRDRLSGKIDYRRLRALVSLRA